MEHQETRFIRIPAAMKRYSLSRPYVVAVAKRCGALRRIPCGANKFLDRIDTVIMDEKIDAPIRAEKEDKGDVVDMAD